ncbi:MAG: tetratricopeptide repeat protein [Candidatus Thorarchaeota archaeon]
MRSMKFKPSILPNEFRYHFKRIDQATIDQWISFKELNPFLRKNPSFLEISNGLLDSIETEFITNPEFVWIACKSGIITGQLNRVLDISWKYSESYIRGQSAFALAFKGKTTDALALLKAAEYNAEKEEDIEVLVDLFGIRAFTLAVEKKFEEVTGAYIKATQYSKGQKGLTQWAQLARTRAAYAMLKLGYISDSSIINNQVLSLANQSGDRFYKIQALNGLGHCLDRVSKTDDALKLYQKALGISLELKSVNLSSVILNRMGMAYAWRKKDLNGSIDYFKRSIAYSQEGESDWLIFGPMANLAIIKKMSGDYFDAQELFEGVKDRSESSGNLRDQIFAYINLSDIYRELGDNYRSQEYKKIADDLTKYLQSEFRF